LRPIAEVAVEDLGFFSLWVPSYFNAFYVFLAARLPFHLGDFDGESWLLI